MHMHDIKDRYNYHVCEIDYSCYVNSSTRGISLQTASRDPRVVLHEAGNRKKMI